MNFAAVIVLFNPDELGEQIIIRNILSYANKMQCIYIVDNSSSNNSKIAKAIPKSIYMQNFNKGGIAGALNRGCERALSEGFEWCMTMDQDSIFDEENLNTYLSLVEGFIKKDNTAVSFGPDTIDLNKTVHWTKKMRYNILSPIKRKVLGKKYKTRENPALIFPNDVITSANIIHLKAWKSVGGFDEELFIEQVDVNFCRKLIAKSLRIVQFRTVFLEQKFGEKNGFTLLPKHTPKYGSFRLYYIFRNLLIEKKRFPDEKYKLYYRTMLYRYFFDYCINSIHAVKNLQIFIKAYKSYKMFTDNRQQTTDNRQQTTELKLVLVSCQEPLCAEAA